MVLGWGRERPLGGSVGLLPGVSEAAAEREMADLAEQHESHALSPGDTLCQGCARGHGIRRVAHGRRVASYLRPLAAPSQSWLPMFVVCVSSLELTSITRNLFLLNGSEPIRTGDGCHVYGTPYPSHARRPSLKRGGRFDQEDRKVNGIL